MTSLIEIDGSQGEGGGQIIRSSLALSAVTGKPFRILNIRAGRRKPGLKNQHVVAAQAASRICNAKSEGIALGSSELTFEPSEICGGHYEFRVGSAGSTSLVAQTILPALMMADQPSTVVIEGGTHNPLAPTFDFLRTSYLPQLAKCGPIVDAEIEQRGFFPAGGGRVKFGVHPSPQLTGYDLIDRGQSQDVRVVALVSNLPLHVGQREVDTICRKAGWSKKRGRVIKDENPRGPGNVVSIELEYKNVTAVFTGFGERGVPAEKVAAATYRQAKSFIDSDFPVEEYLADQLMLPMGLAASQGHTSRFRTHELSKHSLTHIDILQMFLEITIDMQTADDDSVVVTISPE